VDELDAAIVRELQQDARLSNRELASRLGLAPSTCLVRTRALRERGVLKGFHAEVDLTRVGLGVQALISIQVRPLSRTVIESFHAFAMDLPEVLAVFVLAGGDDFLVHVAVRDLTALHALLMDKFSPRKEIIGFRSSVIFQHTQRPPRIDFDQH
jgi:DNA-binding Lrp family transcriptional regulator